MNAPIPILTDHSISDEIHARILAELAMTEAKHGVKVLFACESGSRGWGFASQESDYDVRFVYAHPLEWYLRLEAQRDVIEQPVSNQLDLSGWELRKALRLMRRSNPTLFEWLDSPVVYQEDPGVVRQLRALGTAFFSEEKGRWHYMSMAKKNFRGCIQGDTVHPKRYLYALRPLLAAQWIDTGWGMPPMRFAELAEAMVSDPALLEEINALLNLNMSQGETGSGEGFPLIHGFIERGLEVETPPREFRQPTGDPAILDRFLLEIARTTGG